MQFILPAACLLRPFPSVLLTCGGRAWQARRRADAKCSTWPVCTDATTLPPPVTATCEAAGETAPPPPPPPPPPPALVGVVIAPPLPLPPPLPPPFPGAACTAQRPARGGGRVAWVMRWWAKRQVCSRLLRLGSWLVRRAARITRLACARKRSLCGYLVKGEGGGGGGGGAEGGGGTKEGGQATAHR